MKRIVLPYSGKRKRLPSTLLGILLSAFLLGVTLPSSTSAEEGAGIRLGEINPDLAVPTTSEADPAPGRRVREFLPRFEKTGIYHLLHLPEDWKPGERYPVLFEYPGNSYRESPGTVEGCTLGYGVTGGKGAIWVSLPFVDLESRNHATQWWGDVEATVKYCRDAVEWICSEYGGDPERLFLAGFSRGAIACNFIGLHDEEISALWRGMICHSHYDGVRKWGYPGSDRDSARERLARLAGRPQWISHESSIDEVREYLDAEAPDGKFTFRALPFRDHTADWVLRDIPARREIRKWFQDLASEGEPIEKADKGPR